MKKHTKHLFAEIVSDENIYQAYLNARRHKRYRKDVLEFSRNLEYNLVRIQKELISGNFSVPAYREFYVYEPKCRLILAQNFEEVVKQWAFYQVLNPIFSGGYIEDSYACIKGRGQIAAVLRLHYWLRLVNKNRHNAEKRGLPVKDEDKWYYLKIDFSKYFYRVDHEILEKRINKKIQDPMVRKWLISRVNHPTIKFGLPLGKRPEDVLLEERLSDKGMPVGALTSQMLANVYNDVLDQYCKRTLQIRYYIRYQDDIIILSNSKQQLHDWHKKIERFANDEMAMVLNEKTCIRPITLGIDFCGYKQWATHIKMRKSTALRMKRRLKKVMEEYAAGEITLEKANQVVDSYLGLLSHCNSMSLKTQIFGDYDKGIEGWFVLRRNRKGDD